MTASPGCTVTVRPLSTSDKVTSTPVGRAAVVAVDAGLVVDVVDPPSAPTPLAPPEPGLVVDVAASLEDAPLDEVLPVPDVAAPAAPSAPGALVTAGTVLDVAALETEDLPPPPHAAPSSVVNRNATAPAQRRQVTPPWCREWPREKRAAPGDLCRARSRRAPRQRGLGLLGSEREICDIVTK